MIEDEESVSDVGIDSLAYTSWCWLSEFYEKRSAFFDEHEGGDLIVLGYGDGESETVHQTVVPEYR